MQDNPVTNLSRTQEAVDRRSAADTRALSNSHTASLVRIPVAIQIMLGTARMPLSDLLALRQGSLFPLEQKLGEPVTLIVNGCRIASGELFVLEGDKLGVKIKDILNSAAG
jgi:flagellar motor switch protein FliN/FliY